MDGKANEQYSYSAREIKGVEMYESKISNKKWWVFGLLSDIGWIAFYIGLILYVVKIGIPLSFTGLLYIILLACGILILRGIVEIIDERKHKLDRLLPKKRLLRGFGCVVYGSLAGTVTALVALVSCLVSKDGTQLGILYMGLMCFGAFICFIFGFPLFKAFKKIS